CSIFPHSASTSSLGLGQLSHCVEFWPVDYLPWEESVSRQCSQRRDDSWGISRHYVWPRTGSWLVAQGICRPGTCAGSPSTRRVRGSRSAISATHMGVSRSSVPTRAKSCLE